MGSYIHKISEQTTILNRLVHSLLDVSRIDRGNLALEMEQFSMNELIQETIESLQPTTHIPIYFQAHKKASVNADKNRIRQVLINLLSNAIKYSPSEGSVEIRLYKEIDRCIVSVKDSGIGIEKKHLALVFKRFFRVYGHDTRRFAGMGMGLYISHEIIKGHKGKIWVESEKGKGSTFFFSLPTSY